MLRTALLWLAGFALAAATASEQLNGLVGADGVIEADAKTLASIFAAPRNFTTAILFTTDSTRVECPFCKVIGPDFRKVAGQYKAQVSADARELYFVCADLDNNMPAFKTLGLTHVPNLAFYPPAVNKGDVKRGLGAAHQFMTFLSTGPQVDHLLKTLRSRGFDIQFAAEFQWQRLFKTVVTLVAVLAGAYVLRAPLLRVYQSKRLWLAGSLVAIVMFIAGHMYNVTRGAKFMGMNGGDYVLVDPSFSSQFAVETQIVATLYSLLAFATVGLIKYVAELQTVQAQSVAAAIGSTLILVLYSVLISTFRIKSGLYPISLLPIKIF